MEAAHKTYGSSKWTSRCAERLSRISDTAVVWTVDRGTILAEVLPTTSWEELVHKAGIDNQDKILCTTINGPIFFGNFWQGQDGRAFDFLAGFLFVGYLGPEMSSKFWQVIPQQFKGAWFTPNGFLGAFFVWFAWKPQKTVTVRSCVSHDICVSKLGLLDTFSWSTIRLT